MVYRATILRRLAITQMVFGAVMFVFGITSIFVAEHWTSFIAFGVWVGVWVSFETVQTVQTVYYSNKLFIACSNNRDLNKPRR